MKQPIESPIRHPLIFSRNGRRNPARQVTSSIRLRAALACTHLQCTDRANSAPRLEKISPALCRAHGGMLAHRLKGGTVEQPTHWAPTNVWSASGFNSNHLLCGDLLLRAVICPTIQQTPAPGRQGCRTENIHAAIRAARVPAECQRGLGIFKMGSVRSRRIQYRNLGHKSVFMRTSLQSLPTGEPFGEQGEVRQSVNPNSGRIPILGMANIDGASEFDRLRKTERRSIAKIEREGLHIPGRKIRTLPRMCEEANGELEWVIVPSDFSSSLGMRDYNSGPEQHGSTRYCKSEEAQQDFVCVSEKNTFCKI